MSPRQRRFLEVSGPVLDLWWRGLSFSQIALMKDMTRGQVAGIVWRATRKRKLIS